MGDIKKQKKKYYKPGHPWNKERILEEAETMKLYGLRRKRELWKMSTMLKEFLHQAKAIIGSKTAQSEVEKKQLLNKIYKLGLLSSNSRVEDVLNLTLKNILERRLQTLVYRKNMANSVMQARQFITHQHIAISDKKITSPAYLVTTVEESNIKFANDSDLKNVKFGKEIKEAKVAE